MDENMQQPGGMSERETLLYQLFKRHLFRTGQEPENQVLVGQIPVDLPEKVPLPLGSRVLGTILSWQYIEILFDATLSPTAVIDFYKEQLSQTGWQEREQVLRTVLGERGMGMSPADTSSETSETDYKYQEFLRTANGPSLRVTADASSGDGTQIQIQLDLSVHKYTPSPAQRLFPVLHLPEDGKESSSSYSTSDYDAHHFCVIQFAHSIELSQLLSPKEFSETERETLAAILSECEAAKTIYQLVQEFRQILHRREGEKLDGWLSAVRASHIRELQSFVGGIECDKAAVVAGLTLPQNNGLVEGKVNKLKLIKRMGYGRAGFPLLRQRVLHAL